MKAAVKGFETRSLMFHIKVLAATVVGVCFVNEHLFSLPIQGSLQTSGSLGSSRKVDVRTAPPAAPEGVSVLSKLIVKSFSMAGQRDRAVSIAG